MGSRSDFLFDFTISAAELAERATPTRIRAHRFDVASEDDLLRLKQIARAQISAPGDLVDISFLEGRRMDVE